LNFFGCAPKIVVPDNLKSGITRECRYDPDVNETYCELARHYGFAVIPARKRSPKDKAKVEAGVLLVTRWILAALRHRRFFSLDELNLAIRELLEQLNTKAFQKMPGSRRSAFLDLDQPAAQPLPSLPYVYTEVRKARVNIDYHLAIEDHYYSVPYQLRGEQVTVRLTTTSLEILHKNRRLCCHQRSYKKWGYTTLSEHMPKAHQAHAEWTPSRIIAWAARTGPATARFVEEMIKTRAHPEQGFRAALGVMRLTDRFGSRVEAACQRAISFQAYRYRYLKSILERGLDRELTAIELIEAPIVHENIRGSAYYQNLGGEKDANQRNLIETKSPETSWNGESLRGDSANAKGP
jgi:transposase